VVNVRTLWASDADAVVERIVGQLEDDASRQPLVNAHVDREVLRSSILRATASTWVALDQGNVVGHLYAAVLSDPAHPLAAWTGPDGASFDDEGILHELVDSGRATWRRAGATQHFSWTLFDDERIDPWRALGYQSLSVRGVMRLEGRVPRLLPAGMVVRAATNADLDRALELDHVIDVAQGDSDTTIQKDPSATRRELIELLGDPEVSHSVVEFNGRVLAQAVAFAVPSRRGSFDKTLHLSEVVVDPDAQGHGVATAMIDDVLDHARRDGFEYVEAQWRVTNERAATFWPRYGLTPTYVRLASTLDLGE
jgi:ribosomal protein S18 acetylase RimI-like enzyme